MSGGIIWRLGDDHIKAELLDLYVDGVSGNPFDVTTTLSTTYDFLEILFFITAYADSTVTYLIINGDTSVTYETREEDNTVHGTSSGFRVADLNDNMSAVGSLFLNGKVENSGGVCVAGRVTSTNMTGLLTGKAPISSNVSSLRLRTTNNATGRYVVWGYKFYL